MSERLGMACIFAAFWRALYRSNHVYWCDTIRQ